MNISRMKEREGQVPQSSESIFHFTLLVGLDLCFVRPMGMPWNESGTGDCVLRRDLIGEWRSHRSRRRDLTLTLTGRSFEDSNRLIRFHWIVDSISVHRRRDERDFLETDLLL